MKFHFQAILLTGLLVGAQAADRPNILLINVAKANPSVVAGHETRLNDLPPYQSD